MMKNKQLIVTILVVSLGLIMLLGTSYALITKTFIGTKTYSMTVGSFQVDFTNNNTITLGNSLPTTYTNGLAQANSFDFTIINNGDYSASYSIKIEETSINPISEVIDYVYNMNNRGYSSMHNLGNNDTFVQNIVLSPGSSHTYSMKFWLDEKTDASYMGKAFSAKIKIETTQSDYKYATSVVELLGNNNQDGVVMVDNTGKIVTSNENISEYRYTGNTTDNYVWFNCDEGYTKGSAHCEKWRIIGSMNNSWEKGTGTYKSLKLVRDEFIDLSTLTTGHTYSGNTDSKYLMYYTNEIYSLKGNSSNLVLNAKWNIGVTNNSIKPYSSYLNEQSEVIYGKVGLISPSDYGYAGGIQNLDVNLNNSTINLTNNWLYKGENKWLTINQTNTDNSVNMIGMINDNTSGVVEGLITSSNLIRLSVYLKPDVSIISGMGNNKEPYELSIKFPMTYGIIDNDFMKLNDALLLNETNLNNVNDAKKVIEAKGQVDVNNIAPTYDSEGNINGGDLGLYAQEDDYGTSYFYRGAVTNNNVKFAGFYWKIIRINGDGSIRLILNGSTSGATGNATSINGTSYTYNPKYPDPTYVGYMYGDNLVSQESLETDYYNIAAATSYVFAKNYDIVSGTTNYKLRDDSDDPNDTITKKFSEMNAMMENGGTDNFFTEYPYTCMTTSSSSQCQVIIKVSSYNEASNYATATYTSFSSTGLENTRLNNASSNIKNQLETWYQNNILNKNDSNGNSYSKYIIDQTFCNDRSMPDAPYNSGYLRNIYTYYGGYQRLGIDAEKTAKLTCNGDIRDTFSAMNTKGNGLLTYPVGLITADEVALAGMKWGSVNANPNNYLTTGGYFWTMTPSFFNSPNANAYALNVYPSGYLFYNNTYYGLGARAVINLSPNIVIAKGNGTSEAPYEVKLK